MRHGAVALVHRVVLGLVAMVLLASCGGTLQIPASRPIGQNTLPTATKGIPVQNIVPLPSADSASPFTSTAPLSTETAAAPAAPSVEQSAAPPLTSAVPNDPVTTVIPELGKVALPLPANLQDRWRAQQINRVVLADQATYVSPAYQFVRWFDPITGQYTTVGQLRSEFTVQATFRIKGDWATALEIPFNPDSKNYGITVPAAIKERMQAIGTAGWCDVFVYQTNDIRPK